MRYASSVRGVLMLAAVFGASAAQGDGVCEKGDRPTTPAERQAMLTAQQVARAALPAAPTGWVIGGHEGELSTRDSICRDVEGTPWAYSVSRTINRTDDAAEREQAMADAGVRARAAQAARQPRIDALTAQGEKLGAELGAAVQKGDQARIAAINREMEAISQEMQTLYSGAEDQAIRESIARVMTQDRTMQVAVSINSGGHLESGAKRATAPAGAHSAYRWTTTADGVSEAHSLVLFGNWQPRDGGGLEVRRRGTASPAAAHAIAVRTDADPARLDSLLGSIDFAALSTIVVR